MEKDHTTLPEEDDNAGLPPVFSSWKQVYALMLIELGALIVLFYLLTKAFA